MKDFGKTTTGTGMGDKTNLDKNKTKTDKTFNTNKDKFNPGKSYDSTIDKQRSGGQGGTFGGDK